MPSNQRVRIVSDGGLFAQITDAETGEPIHKVTNVSIEMQAGEIPRARLTTIAVEMDITAEVNDETPRDVIKQVLADHYGGNLAVQLHRKMLADAIAEALEERGLLREVREAITR